MDMIPRIIHYCWFGGTPLSDSARKCIESWKRFCPNYEIVKWDETNFDINCCDYVREAYETGKWAFVSDVVRLYALVNNGGVYMDTDVEVLKPLDTLLSYDAVAGFETKSRIQTGFMASIAGFEYFKELLHEYDDIHFLCSDGSLDYTSNVERITSTSQKHGLQLNGKFQNICGFTILPQEYLCPKDVVTGELKITENTYIIHHFNSTWSNDEQNWFSQIRRELCRFFPINVSHYLAIFITECRFHGISNAFSKTVKWLTRKSKNNE